MSHFERIGLVADTSEEAQRAKAELLNRYPDMVDIFPVSAPVDVIIVLGGDGFMLQTMHRFIDRKTPLYGMNCGTVGFLLNSYAPDLLRERLHNTREVKLFPLSMFARCVNGREVEALAINEVSLLRESRQAAKIRITVDHVIRIKELVADGVLVSTPAGSSAYNFSAGGPIVPLSANILSLTPLSPFRPRRWRGALLEHTASIMFDVLNPAKRPVSAVADFTEVRDVSTVFVSEQRKISFTLLFDPEHNLEERIRMEQFLD